MNTSKEFQQGFEAGYANSDKKVRSGSNLRTILFGVIMFMAGCALGYFSKICDCKQSVEVKPAPSGTHQTITKSANWNMGFKQTFYRESIERQATHWLDDITEWEQSIHEVEYINTRETEVIKIDGVSYAGILRSYPIQYWSMVTGEQTQYRQFYVLKNPFEKIKGDSMMLLTNLNDPFRHDISIRIMMREDELISVRFESNGTAKYYWQKENW